MASLQQKIKNTLNDSKLNLKEDAVKPSWIDLGPAIVDSSASLPDYTKGAPGSQPALPLSKPVKDDIEGAHCDTNGKVGEGEIKEDKDEKPFFLKKKGDKKKDDDKDGDSDDDDKKKDIKEDRTAEDENGENKKKLAQGDKPEKEKDPMSEAMDDEDSDEDKEKDKKDMEEDVLALFSGEKLTEAFKKKAVTIFESAVSKRVSSKVDRITTRLAEQFNTLVTEATDKHKVALEESVDQYLDYVAQEYVRTNELAIERHIKSELTESFIEGLQKLFLEHYIDVPDSKVDVVETLTAQVEELENKLNESIESNIRLNASITEAATEKVFEDVSRGLAESQIDELRNKVSGMRFANLDAFKEGVTTLKESYFGAGNKSTPVAGSKSPVPAKDLTEETTELPLSPIAEENNEIDQYVEAFTKLNLG